MMLFSLYVLLKIDLDETGLRILFLDHSLVRYCDQKKKLNFLIYCDGLGFCVILCSNLPVKHSNVPCIFPG